MISLVIKGNISAAFKAADAFGVELTSLAYNNNTCYASTIPECMPKVIEWYCDTDGPAPYPAGSLLFYTCGEDR